MKTYSIKYEPIIVEGVEYPKFNVYYYVKGVFESKEFHSIDGVNGTVLSGYTKK